MAVMAGPISISEGRARFLAAIKGPMSTDLAARKELIQRARAFERQRKTESVLAFLRLIGVMSYGPATPTAEQDVELIHRVKVAFGTYKVLSGDQIKLRKSREVQLGDNDGDQRSDDSGAGHSAVDALVYREFLINTFD